MSRAGASIIEYAVGLVRTCAGRETQPPGHALRTLACFPPMATGYRQGFFRASGKTAIFTAGALA
jgi:hypothetical protein